MTCEIIPILPFQRQAKRLIKKFPSLKSQLLNLIESLKTSPMQGILLADNCYKSGFQFYQKIKVNLVEQG